MFLFLFLKFLNIKNLKNQVASVTTTLKIIFSFSRRPEKNRVRIWSFLRYRERWWSDPLDGKWKMSILKKYTEIWYFLQMFWKYGLFKGIPFGYDLSCIIWKDGIFFPKTWYFFLGRKVRGDLFQEIHGNMKFYVYTYGCYKRAAVPLCQKKSKMILSHKNTPEGDWRPRLTF